MEDIIVISKLEFKTYLRISLLFFFKMRSVIIALIYLMLILYFTFANSHFYWDTALTTIGIYLGIYCAVIPVVIYIACKANMKKSAILNEELTYRINEDKIELKGETVSASRNWQYIPKLIEREKYFLLMLSARMFHYLPKDGFTSTENIIRFKNMVKEKGIKIKYR